MKKLLIILLIPVVFNHAQPLTFTEWKENIGLIAEMLIREKLLVQDSVTGTWYSEMHTPDQLRALYNKYNAQWINVNKAKTPDILVGTLNSAISGVGNGIMVSTQYDYPSLGNGSLRKWLTSYSGQSDASFYQASEIGKTINDHWNSAAIVRLERYYGKWYWAYLHNLIVKNFFSSVYRGWAQYDKPFHYIALYLDIGYLFNNLFGD